MNTHRFRSRLYHWRDDPTSWVFLDVPRAVSDEIADEASASGPRRGFGSVRVRVTIGPTTWETSVFPSAERGRFVLPVKKSVRKSAGIDAGDQLSVELTVT